MTDQENHQSLGDFLRELAQWLRESPLQELHADPAADVLAAAQYADDLERKVIEQALLLASKRPPSDEGT